MIHLLGSVSLNGLFEKLRKYKVEIEATTRSVVEVKVSRMKEKNAKCYALKSSLQDVT